MKIHIYLSSLAMIFLLASIAAGLTGCETESAASAIHITPSTAQITQGQSITLTATGGYTYRWSIQNPTWGFLSSAEGASVTYTSLLESKKTSDTNGVVTTPAPQIQTVTVVSTIPGDSTSSSSSSIVPGTSNTTTTTSAGATGSATAQIYHIAN